MKTAWVYIMASGINGTIYTGVTSDLPKRIWEHRNSEDKAAFTKKYRVFDLVYFEQFDDIMNAIAREKRLKKYRRADKIKLIEKSNPNWKDLYEEVCI